MATGLATKSLGNFALELHAATIQFLLCWS